jgi:hypothetical protein
MRKQNNKNHKRARRSNRSPGNESFVTYLSAEISIDTTTQSILINPVWYNFFGFTNLAKTYHYFVPLAHKIQISANPNYVNTSGNFATAASFAFYPINAAIGEIPLAGTVSSNADVLMLAGAVNLQFGARNIGKFQPWPFKQTQIPAIDYSSSDAGSFLGYFETDGSTTALVCSALITVKFRFTRRIPIFNTSSTAGLKLFVRDPVEEEKEEDVSVAIVASRSKGKSDFIKKSKGS